jgi:hypothetical protein
VSATTTPNLRGHESTIASCALPWGVTMLRSTSTLVKSLVRKPNHCGDAAPLEFLADHKGSGRQPQLHFPPAPTPSGAPSAFVPTVTARGARALHPSAPAPHTDTTLRSWRRAEAPGPSGGAALGVSADHEAPPREPAGLSLCRRFRSAGRAQSRHSALANAGTTRARRADS